MRVIIVKKRSLVIGGLLLAAVIAAVVLILVFGGGEKRVTFARPTMRMSDVEEYELNVLAGKSRELPVYSVECAEKKLALTVDAAWEDDKTEFILDVLKKHDVKATFFLCGVWVETYPEHVKAIAAQGHEIGNHSLTHPHMNQLDAAGVQSEITKLDDQIETLTSKRCTLFRAPYGEYNDTVIKAVREIGYEAVQWDIDTIDWKRERSADMILNGVIPKLAPGSIILCHNNGYEIKNYLPILIEKAQEAGYSFVTVSELLLSGETKIDNNGRQHPA